MQKDAMYVKAANLVVDYANDHTVSFRAAKDEIVNLLDEFKKKYAPEKLKSLSDGELLSYLFLTADGNYDNLCYHLEFNPKLKKTFGSISGGSSFKFGLFQRQEDGKWVTGAPKTPKVLSESEALQLGKRIRDYLVSACEMIESQSFESVEDYEKLDEDLNSMMGKFASYAWIQKYLHMIFPDKFIGWYVSDWLRHILFGLGIIPSDKYYGMNGQLSLIKNKTGYMSPEFQDICYAIFGGVRHFYRLGSSDESDHYAEKWREKGIVAIGWKETGDLLDYVKNGSIDRDKVAAALSKHYYQTDKKTASRKAGEIKSFYETAASSVIVVMDGAKPIAFVDGLSPYFYDANEKMGHQKLGVWHSSFTESDRLPKAEGLLTTIYEIKEPENLLYLYKRYYWPAKVDKKDTHVQISFNTGYKSSFQRNRILFGAPGTGKSYTINQELKLLIGESNEEDYERVTFHPDYAYANFVGTYKPVPSKDSQGNDAITYSYVPGPFMRMYVKALKNSQGTDTKPFLLIIEEINRANVAAVFGDVFQLLDRGDDEVSEYPIEASEEIKSYLAKELGGVPNDYAKIRIPDNLFIWATMNSADQGVFPMDTAFKRRWDFTYLGIDNGEEQIQGKTVILGEGEHKRTVEWNSLRKEINRVLLNDCKVNEDKLMGPFFIAIRNIATDNTIDEEAFKRVFKNKVIMYLFDDAAKQKRTTLFDGCEIKNQYSSICEEFDVKGVDIFSESIRSAFPVTNDEDKYE